VSEAIEPGPIVDRKGCVLGRHKGIPFYTVGQRRGLRLATGSPLYVIGIDRSANAVVVGGEREVYREAFVVSSVNWMIPEKQKAPFSAQVKIRYNHPGSEAVISPGEKGEVEIRFKTPQKAITQARLLSFMTERR